MENEAIAWFGLGKIDLENMSQLQNLLFRTKGHTCSASLCTKLIFLISLSLYNFLKISFCKIKCDMKMESVI